MTGEIASKHSFEIARRASLFCSSRTVGEFCVAFPRVWDMLRMRLVQIIKNDCVKKKY